MKNKFNVVKWILKQSKSSTTYMIIIVILGGISSLFGIYRATVTKKMIDCATNSNLHQMLIFVAVLGLLIINDIIIRAVSSALSVRSSTTITNTIQKKLYSHIMRTKWIELSKYHSGDILTRLTTDIEALTNMIVNLLPSILSLTVLIIGSFFTLLSYDPIIAVLILLISPIPILLSKIYAKKFKRLYVKIQEMESCYRSFINESVQNIVIIKSFCLEQNNLNKVSNMQKNKLNLIVKRNRINIISSSILSFGPWLSFILVFGLGGLKLSNGTATFGTLTAMLQLIANIQGPFSSLSSALPQVISAIASSERLIELENLSLDSIKSIDSDITSAGIRFENISFAYQKHFPIVSNITVNIHPGDLAAIVGPSGQGKTTLIRLLLSLFQADRGAIYLTTNKEKYEVSTSSRKFISYVPQGNTLFSGTIADNLRFGNPNAMDSELEAAARAACAWEFIETLQNGLYTVIGEKGLGLSEGQAQRLAIARSLLNTTPILILDEATSSLDTETEIKVLQSIKHLIPKRTCIIITHRLEALKICNRIFKLENTNLIELQNYINDDAAIESIS